MDKLKYQMVIQWSDLDNCYLVGFPDFIGQTWRTHGESYQEAVQNGVDCLESLIEDYEAAGETLPEPTAVLVAA